jgi:nucleoside-diphosphate-sugar epimerase
MLRVAVTGAGGFIGQYVMAELERRKILSTVVVRPSTVLPDRLAGHQVVFADSNNPQSNLYELMGYPDVVIHLAWSGLPNYKSHHHFEDELSVQFQFLKRLVESGLQNVVVAGTCFEYGMQSGSLTEDLPLKPTNPYGFAKNSLRCQLEYLQQIKPFNMTWARLFYVYGEGQAENSLLPQLKQAVDRGDKIFNMSGGEQLRDFVLVSEVAKYLVSLASTLRNNEIVNVCSGKPISVRKFAEDWIRENNWSIELNLGYYPYPDHEPMAFWGDRRKLDQCLGLE